MSTLVRSAVRPKHLVAAGLAVLLALLALAGFRADDARSAPAPGQARTLVLYDTTGQWGWLGELYAMNAANLSGHFGRAVTKPVSTYVAGDVGRYDATIYIGSTYDEPLPASFLDDVNTSTKPVIWMANNIWQLTARDATFASRTGWTWKAYDNGPFTGVTYKGTQLERSVLNNAPIMDLVVSDPAKATVLSTAQKSDGTSIPWATRSGSLTYIGEIPFSYVGENDRTMVLSDLMFDALAPTTATRHRALVRIEDVGPDADPAQLRRIADYLASRKVPFSVATYPVYRDPLGVENGGRNTTVTLQQRPQVVSALKYMQSKGGTILMHGYTHQYSNVPNPYDGQSGNDFEFFRAHVDAQDRVIYDGPVAEDSVAWAKNRMNSSKTEFQRAGLTVPTIFEFPHYAGSAADYRAVRELGFAGRYERGLYFAGQLSGGTINHSRMIGQFFPYGVTDINGTRVIPENLGNYEPEAYNTHPARMPEQIIDTARRNLVVRDGFASFFYHPYLADACPTSGPKVPCINDLKTIVEGIQGLGYTFVTPASVLSELPAAGTTTQTATARTSLLRPAGVGRVPQRMLVPTGFAESEAEVGTKARRCVNVASRQSGRMARVRATAACLAGSR